MLPAGIDGRAAVERRLQLERDVAASHPGSLAALVSVAHRLRQLGRPAESLATLRTARPDNAEAAVFTDLDELLNWWWDGLA